MIGGRAEELGEKFSYIIGKLPGLRKLKGTRNTWEQDLYEKLSRATGLGRGREMLVLFNLEPS